MTREDAIRGYNRMMDYLNEVNSAQATLMGTFFDDDMKEAWFRTVEELDFDDLDKGSKIWFIDDPEEYNKALVDLIEDTKKGQKFQQIFARHLVEATKF